LLREFSRRTTEELRAALPLRLALPALEPFLAENVAKEVRKDALVIRCAAEALTAGTPPGPGIVRSLLVAARDIDREFLSRAAGLPVRIEIRYDVIDPLRLRRMEAGLELAYRVLDAWRARRRLRATLAPDDIERRLFEILRLYAEETQALSHSARLPRILEPLREGLTQRLREVMIHGARGLARDAARGGRRGTRTAGPPG
jgi:hypothetical protein